MLKHKSMMVKMSGKEHGKRTRKRNPWKLAYEDKIVDTLAQVRIGEVHKSRWQTGQKPREDILEIINMSYRRLGPGKFDDDLREYFSLRSDLIALNKVKGEIEANKDRRKTYKVEEEIQEEIDDVHNKLEEIIEEPELQELVCPGYRGKKVETYLENMEKKIKVGYPPRIDGWEDEMDKIAEGKLEKYRKKYRVDELEDGYR